MKKINKKSMSEVLTNYIYMYIFSIGWYQSKAP